MRPITPKKQWTNTMTKATKSGKGKITVTLKGSVGRFIHPYLIPLMAPKKK